MINKLNLGIEDLVTVILGGINNVSIDSPLDIGDCIISIGSIFQIKFNSIDFSVCRLILHDECWSVNRVLINDVNKILTY